jgi:hypothetical protein
MRRAACHPHPATAQIQKEQNVNGHQSAQGPNLFGKEVRRPGALQVRLNELLPRQPFAINRLAEFWELLFIGESIPASAHGANSKRILRFVLGADEFLHPSSHRLMVALVEFTFVQVSPFVGSTVRLPRILQNFPSAIRLGAMEVKN